MESYKKLKDSIIKISDKDIKFIAERTEREFCRVTNSPKYYDEGNNFFNSGSFKTFHISEVDKKKDRVLLNIEFTALDDNGNPLHKFAVPAVINKYEYLALSVKGFGAHSIMENNDLSLLIEDIIEFAIENE